MGGPVSPIVQVVQMGDSDRIRRVRGGKMKGKAESLEVGPDDSERGIVFPEVQF